jgi:hypothetical protein
MIFSYSGQWQNNKKHGEGRFYYVNGDMYFFILVVLDIKGNLQMI